MKKHFLNSICFPICVFAALTIPYRAAAADAPSVEVQITPDKASYAQGDCPSFDVAVINHNDYDISDLTLNATASDAIHLTENAEYQMEIGAFETKNYTIAAEEGIVQQTTAETEAVTASSTSNSKASSTTAQTTKAAAPKTGDNAGDLYIVLIAAAIVVMLMFCAKRKRTYSLMSLLLCTAILANICCSDRYIAEASEKSQVSVSVPYGKQTAVLTILADYEAAKNIIHPDYSKLGEPGQESTYLAPKDFDGISGTLDESDTVTAFSYETRDAWDTLLTQGDITANAEWSTASFGLVVGVNILTLTAKQKDGTVFKKTIRINNLETANAHDLLVDMDDADGDKLPAYYEGIYGTDPAKADSDDDGVNDSDEMFVYGTDPLKADTDGDGLSDGDEINTHHSNALLADTDNDGISDSDAVAQGTDPSGEKEDQTVRSQTVQTNLNSPSKPLVTGVSVTMDAAGTLKKHLHIQNVEQYDTLSANVVGALSAPVEISADVPVESATITFTYDADKLGDIPAENLAVMWYDKANNQYCIFDKDTVVDTEAHTVSYTTTHFSTYLIVDREVWYDCWRENIDYRDADAADNTATYDIGFCVDVSGSMYGSYIEKAKTALNTFIDAMLPQDHACLISFSHYATMVAEYGTSKEDLRTAVGTLNADGGTDTNTGLSMTIQEMTEKCGNPSTKIIVMICDGDVNYIQSTIDAAKTAGIVIYTINVVSGDNRYLQQIADETGGEYYYAATSEEVVKQVETIRGTTVSSVDMTDSDGDGLYDVYESRGMRIQNGQVYYSDPTNPDTDGDGKTDYEELAGLPTSAVMDFANGKYSCVLCRAASDPNLYDSDSDGIPDAKDPDPHSHFGMLDNNYHFELTNSIDDFEMPDYIKDIKATEAQHEYEVLTERYPWILEHPVRGFAYMEALAAGAALTWEFGYVGDLVFLTWDLGCKALSLIPGVHFVGSHNINNAAYMLLYYNSNLGGTVGFDATDLVTATEGGKAHFDSNMAQLKKAFENSLMPGESRVITSAGDASITAWNLQGSLLNSNEADGWLSLNKCNAVIVAEGSFDGTTYTAKVNYYVVDRYDFYEPNPTDGAENEVGFVTNDGYVLLSYYDYAEPFDVVGYYTTTISWTK